MAYINARQGFERQLVHGWMDSFYTKEKTKVMETIQDEIEKKEVSKTLQKIAWILQKSR